MGGSLGWLKNSIASHTNEALDLTLGPVWYYKDMRYRHVSQKPYCCVPACLSMILSRRGYKSPKQEDIAYDLGVVLPPEHVHLLPRSHDAESSKAGYGTRIHLKQFSITSFFKKKGYRLEEKYVSAKRFKTSHDFGKFLKNNLDKGNDQMICFNQGRLKGKKRSWGHCAVIARVGEKVVFMYDPDPRKRFVERRVSIKKLYDATKHHFRGGIWIIHS